MLYYLKKNYTLNNLLIYDAIHRKPLWLPLKIPINLKLTIFNYSQLPDPYRVLKLVLLEKFLLCCPSLYLYLIPLSLSLSILR